MCLHIKVCHYAFNIKIYCICQLQIAVILNSYSFFINTGWHDVTNGTFQQIDVIIEGVL